LYYNNFNTIFIQNYTLLLISILTLILQILPLQLPSHTSILYFFPPWRNGPSRQGLLIIDASRWHSDTPHSVDASGRVIGLSHRPVSDNTQRPQETRHRCCRQYSNQKTQQESGRRPTP